MMCGIRSFSNSYHISKIKINQNKYSVTHKMLSLFFVYNISLTEVLDFESKVGILHIFFTKLTSLRF